MCCLSFSVYVLGFYVSYIIFLSLCAWVFMYSAYKCFIPFNSIFFCFFLSVFVLCFRSFYACVLSVYVSFLFFLCWSSIFIHLFRFLSIVFYSNHVRMPTSLKNKIKNDFQMFTNSPVSTDQWTTYLNLKLLNRQTDGRTDGRTDGQMDRETDRRTDE